MDSPQPTRTDNAYRVARDTRNFEIELFWKRAIFFWAFVAAAFAAFGSTYQEDPGLALVLAGFGMVCSAAWTLANRGSKHWQETWERRLEALEVDVTGPLFGVDSPSQTEGIPWLRSRRYSVSKLAIALSDFITLLWLILAVGQLLRIQGFEPQLRDYSKLGSAAFFALVCGYIGALMLFCRTSQRSSANTSSSEPDRSPQGAQQHRGGEGLGQ